MEFCHLALFNQVMLGRHGWVAATYGANISLPHVLKGRYFPHYDLWHALKPRSSSYTRQSILFGHGLLFCGVQSGIGDGKLVKISLDHEILVRSSYLVRRVNSTNVLDEGLRIGEIGRQMNSKVKLVEIGVYRK
jgi:hypothetical protein